MNEDLAAGTRRAVSWLTSDAGAKWALRAAVVVSLAVYYVIGRNQWFVRDDWGFVVTRNAIRTNGGWKAWLFEGQDGHWMTVPILVWRGIQNVFQLGSYWPYLIPTIALHLTAVFLIRAICRRLGVSAWTTTLVCALLLVFGSGWDNFVFAIQITYNLSLVAFLAQIVLTDHDGPANRRDFVAASLGLVGVMSSGFGPIFVVGIAILLVLRQRWSVLAVVVGPQALAIAWWFGVWGGDAVADRVPGARSQIPAFVARGVVATFEGLTAFVSLAGLGLFACLAVTLWRGHGWRVQGILLTLWATVGVLFAAIGLERIGFGVASAGSSRYVHVTGILLAPAVAVAVDQLRRIATEARVAAYALLVVSAVLNAGWLHVYSAEWAKESRNQRRVFQLTMGSGYVGQVDPQITPVDISPNITVGWLPYLLEQNAIELRPLANDEELRIVRVALGLEAPSQPPSAVGP